MIYKPVPERIELGQGLAEYALILILVAAVVIVVLLFLGSRIGNTYENIITHIPPP